MEEIIIIIGSFWSFSTIAVPFVIELIYEKIAEPQTKLWKSIWSWVIPIALTYVLWLVGIYFEIGYLVEYTVWWTPAIFGAISAGISNYGWNNIPWVKQMIIYIISLLPKFKK